MENLDLREHKKVIRKNALWLFWGQLVGRLLRTAIIIYPARILTQESWGAFNYALGIATFLTVLSDIGVNALLTREASKNPEGRKEYISTSFFIKMAILLTLGIGFVMTSEIFLENEEVSQLLPFMLFIFIFDSLRDLGTAIARASERMEKEGFNNILTNFFIATFGFIFLYYSRTTASIALAYAVGTGLGLLSIAFALREEVRVIFSNFNKKLVRHIIVSAWPFGLVGLMGTIMLNTDIFIIGWLKSLTDVALYSAPQKIVQLLYIAPVLVSTAFFPAFARYVGDKKKFAHLFETGIAIISAIVTPIAIGSLILAPKIIDFIYGPGFEESVGAFIILVPTIIIFSLVVLVGNAIFAHDKPKIYITYAILGIFGNFVLDLILIPMWGINGAALATLLNQIIISAYAWYEMKKIAKFKVLNKIKKILIASSGMAFITIGLNFINADIFVNILISGLSYLVLLSLMKEESLSQFWGNFPRRAIPDDHLS